MIGSVEQGVIATSVAAKMPVVRARIAGARCGLEA